MATSIHDFSSKFKGGVRANLFQCRVQPPNRIARDFEFHCKGTSMPASTIGNIDVAYETNDAIETFEATYRYQFFETNTTT